MADQEMKSAIATEMLTNHAVENHAVENHAATNHAATNHAVETDSVVNNAAEIHAATNSVVETNAAENHAAGNHVAGNLAVGNRAAGNHVVGNHAVINKNHAIVKPAVLEVAADDHEQLDRNMAEPERIATMPKFPAAVPKLTLTESHVALHESLTVVSESQAKVHENRPTTSESLFDEPNHLAVPESHVAVPESHVAIPKSHAKVSESLVAVPKSPAEVSECLVALTDGVVVVPMSGKDLAPCNSEPPTDINSQEGVNSYDKDGSGSDIAIVSVVSMAVRNQPEPTKHGIKETDTTAGEAKQKSSVSESTKTNESIEESDPKLQIVHEEQNYEEQSEENVGDIEMTIVDVRSLSEENDNCITDKPSADGSAGCIKTQDRTVTLSSGETICSETVTASSIVRHDSFHKAEVLEASVAIISDFITVTKTDAAIEKESDVEETLVITNVRSLSEDRSSSSEETGINDSLIENIEKSESEKVNNRLDPVAVETTQEGEEHKCTSGFTRHQTKWLGIIQSREEGAPAGVLKGNAESSLDRVLNKNAESVPKENAKLAPDEAVKENAVSAPGGVLKENAKLAPCVVLKNNAELAPEGVVKDSAALAPCVVLKDNADSAPGGVLKENAELAPDGVVKDNAESAPARTGKKAQSAAVNCSGADSSTSSMALASLGTHLAEPARESTLASVEVSDSRCEKLSQKLALASDSVKNKESRHDNKTDNNEIPSKNGLPVISSIFSIKDEPLDDGSYGLMPGSGSRRDAPTGTNTGSISAVINKLQGKKVNPPPVAMLNPKVIKMTPVSYPLTQAGHPGKGTPVQYMYPNMVTSSQKVVLTTPNGPQNYIISDKSLRMVSQSTSNSSKVMAIQKQADLIGQSVKVISYPPVSNSSKAFTISNQAAGWRPEAVKILYPTFKAVGDTRNKPILPRGGYITTTSSTQPVKKTKSQETNTEGKSDTKLDTNEYINIQTVGVEKVTELIARKNPIPMYKPAPVPDELKEVSANRKLYPCLECGDTFCFEKSLMIHMTRISMKLQYSCSTCCKNLNFTNKCQLLTHLRSHLNIDKSQAVPIHIKSDSIQIKSMFEEIVVNKNFEWYDERKVDFGKNYDSCVVCGAEYSGDEQRSEHFNRCTTPTVLHKCDRCPMNMTNLCSIKLHKNLHSLLQNGVVKVDMICPECGKNFGTTDTAMFYKHLTAECCHSSRLWTCPCTKCSKNFSSESEMKQHLLTELESYYKCAYCPMALKTLGSFINHYKQKHKGTPKSRHVKLIYRCHFCDTLIDDQGFLMSHIQKHVELYQIKGHSAFFCQQCTLYVNSKMKLSRHLQYNPNTHADTSPGVCPYCNASFGNSLELLLHTLEQHRNKPSAKEVEFCECGLVCSSEKMMKDHLCLLNVDLDDTFDFIDVEEVGGLPTSSTSIKSNVGGLSTFSTSIKSNVGVLSTSSTSIKSNVSCSDSAAAPHIEIGDGEFKCPMCLKRFLTRLGKTNHIKGYHRGMQEFICTSCDRMDFGDYFELRNHEIYCVEKSKHPGTQIYCVEKSKHPGTPPEGMRETKDKRKRGKPTEDIKASNASDSESDGETDKNFGKVRLSLKGVNQQNRFIDKGETFKCDKCSEVFSRSSKLTEHVKAEHGLHSCHLCGALYESVSKLKRHLLVNHKGKKPVFYCWVCRGRKIDKFYTEKSSLERHFTQKHRLKTMDTSKIVAEWPDQDMKGVSPEPQTQDTLQTCDSSEDEPPVKKLKVEGENVFKCAKCLFTCESKEVFREHITDHGTANTIQCLECGLCFTVLPSLQRHLFMVHKIRDFTSYIKENAIEEPKELESLDLIEREPEVTSESIESESEEEQAGNALECKVCYKEFDSEHSLKQHMRVHGMAFIRKSRRRIATSKTVREQGPEVTDQSGQDVEDDETLQEEPKVKRARISGSDAEGGVTENAPVNGNILESSLNHKAEVIDTLKVKISVSELKTEEKQLGEGLEN